MKKLLLSVFCSSLVIGAGFLHPLPNSSRSIENGGTLSAIDAYQDGVGAMVIQQGRGIDNSAMNSLVFKYGNTAKTNTLSVGDQVLLTGTVEDKLLAGKLYPDGGSCNDGNPLTIETTWLNGICQGGTTMLHTSCKNILDAGASNGDGIYNIFKPNTTESIPVYCDMTTSGGGWTYLNDSFKISKTGTASANSDLKTINLYPSQSILSVNHFGGSMLFLTPNYTSTIVNQSSGLINYGCAGNSWSTIISFGGSNLNINMSNVYYPGWGQYEDSIQNFTSMFTININNSDLTINTAVSNKLNIGVGGYIGCPRETSILSVKIR